MEGETLFPTQIIATGEPDKAQHIWLGALSENLKIHEMKELIKNIKRLPGLQDKEFADSVFQVSIGANQQIMQEMLKTGNPAPHYGY